MNDTKTPKITVFGVGNAGCNRIDNIAKSDIGNKVKLVAVDEEHNGIESRKADIKITLNKGLPGGLRPGIMPHIARDAALEVYDEILEAIRR